MKVPLISNPHVRGSKSSSVCGPILDFAFAWGRLSLKTARQDTGIAENHVVAGVRSGEVG